MKPSLIFLALFFLILLLSVPSPAQEPVKQTSFEGIELLTGFAWSDTKSSIDYEFIPMIVDLNFNLKPWAKSIGFNPRGQLKFQLESFLCGVTKPNANVEAGNSFALKFGLLPEESKLQPYVKAGLGLLYMSTRTHEQSTKFNFVEYLGLGINYLLSKNTSLALETRFRHLSNANINTPNNGINSYLVLSGINYQF